MEINEALKTAVSGVSAKTGSTIAATDLVPLYDANNNLTGKIPKSELMNAVKASLPALLSDQDTAGTKALSLNSSNVLGSMTMANLASVLGAMSCNSYDLPGTTKIQDTEAAAAGYLLENLYKPGTYSLTSGVIASSFTDKPADPSGNTRLIVIHNSGNNSSKDAWYGWQIWISGASIYMRRRALAIWADNWTQVSYPFELQPYTTLSSLTSALGAPTYWGKTNGNFLDMPSGFHYGGYNDLDFADYNAPTQYGHSTLCSRTGTRGENSYRALYITVSEQDGKMRFRRFWGTSDTGWKEIATV